MLLLALTLLSLHLHTLLVETALWTITCQDWVSLFIKFTHSNGRACPPP